MKNKNLKIIVAGVLVSAACALGGYQALKYSAPDMRNLNGLDKTLTDLKEVGTEGIEIMIDSFGESLEKDYKNHPENYK